MAVNMANTTQSTDVLIGGQVYTISGAEPEYLQKVAAFLNRKIGEVRSKPGYGSLDQSYRELMLNLNLVDEYFRASADAESCRKEISQREEELYAARHELVSLKLKLENALKQEEVLGKRAEEWKQKYLSLQERSGFID